MQQHTVLAWGLAALMTCGMVTPALAKKDEDASVKSTRMNVQIFTRDNDEDVELKVFEKLFGAQVRGHSDVDRDTGERMSDLLLMVTEVSRDRIMVTDQTNTRRAVFVTKNTEITFAESKSTWTPPGHRGKVSRQKGTDFTSTIRVGDMVIVEGVLRAGGGTTASRIRIVDQAWGYDDDGYQRYFGYRAWGEVREVDTRRNRVEVDANIGRKTITLAKGGEVLVDGRKESMAYLRRGDRVVFYYESERSLEAHRIVLLRATERYPEGDRPHQADPDYRYDDRNGDRLPMLDGRVQLVRQGIFFNTLTLRSHDGRNTTVYLGKSIKVTDRRGDTLPVHLLRNGDQLRVYYFEIGGSFFADRVEKL